MKKGIAILITLVSLHSFSQNLSCCKTIKAVEMALRGEWKLQGKSNTISYKFSFNNQKGFIEVLPELNLPPKAQHTQLGALVVNQKEIAHIKKVGDHFFIEIVYAFGSVPKQIFKLNKTTLIYGKGQQQQIFIKDIH